MVYGSGTGSICYDQGLDEHSLLSQKSLKNQGKRPFWPFSAPAARIKGARYARGGGLTDPPLR